MAIDLETPMNDNHSNVKFLSNETDYFNEETTCAGHENSAQNMTELKGLL